VLVEGFAAARTGSGLYATASSTISPGTSYVKVGKNSLVVADSDVMKRTESPQEGAAAEALYGPRPCLS
jgi:hypothetical protein